MINLDKVILSTQKTSKACTQNEVNTARALIRSNFGYKIFEIADCIELWFSDGWCYKYITKTGVIGWYDANGIWQFEDKK